MVIFHSYVKLPEGITHGVSENSVPLNPMVLLIIIPIKWLFVWEYTLFSDKPTHDGDSWGYLRISEVSVC